MKLRVLFLKKIHILYLVVTIFALCIGISFITKKTDIDVFTAIKDKQIINVELTGDGKEDILYINTEKDKYYLQVNSNNKDFYLLPDRKINSMGYYYPYNFMKVNLLDITRDRIPEIFIQSSEKGTPVQHIFFWNGSGFQDTFCSTNNIMGIIDSKNNRTPRFLSGSLSSNGINLFCFMLLNGKIEKAQINDDLPGKLEINGLINYIQSLPYGEPNKPVDIFYPGITGKDLELIGKLSSENKTYKFTDGFFIDSKFNRDGEALEYKWILNFKSKAINQSTNSESISILVRIKRTSEDGHPFKIFSMIQNNK